MKCTLTFFILFFFNFHLYIIIIIKTSRQIFILHSVRIALCEVVESTSWFFSLFVCFFFFIYSGDLPRESTRGILKGFPLSRFTKLLFMYRVEWNQTLKTSFYLFSLSIELLIDIYYKDFKTILQVSRQN